MVCWRGPVRQAGGRFAFRKLESQCGDYQEETVQRRHISQIVALCLSTVSSPHPGQKQGTSPKQSPTHPGLLLCTIYPERRLCRASTTPRENDDFSDHENPS